MKIKKAVSILWSGIFITSLQPFNAAAQFSFATTFGVTAYSEMGRCVLVTPDSGYVICGGMFENADIYNEQPIVIKTDARGAGDWSTIFNIRQPVAAESICQLPDSGFLYIGNRFGGHVFATRIDAKGIPRWTNWFGTDRRFYSFDLAPTQDGNFVFVASEMWLTGGLNKSNADSFQVALFKITPDGALIWRKEYRFSQELAAFHLAAMRDGGFLLAGSLWQANAGQVLVLIKTDAGGDSLWSRIYEYPIAYGSEQVVEAVNGTIYILATSAADHDYLLIHADAKGHILWRQSYGMPGSIEKAAAITPTADEGYLIAGSKSNHIFLVKIDTAGVEQWRRTAFDSCTAASVCQTSDGGFILTGWKQRAGATHDQIPDLDIILLKLDATGSVTSVSKQLQSSIRADFSALQNYPNPFNASTTIDFTLPQSGPVQLSIYDISGRRVKQLLNEPICAAGRHHVRWLGDDDAGKPAASGIYFCRLEMKGAVRVIHSIVYLK